MRYTMTPEALDQIVQEAIVETTKDFLDPNGSFAEPPRIEIKPSKNRMVQFIWIMRKKT